MIKYPLFYPTINNKEEILKNIEEVLDSKFIGQGELVDKFEEEFETYLNDYYPANLGRVVSVNSGTAGLHLAYILAGIKEGDEVITPTLSCTATTHPLLWMKAIPIFADIEKDTLNIDPRDVERKITKKTKAIVVMHNGGMPCDMKEILEIANEYNIKVIEDSCQGLGGELFNGQKLGTIAHYGVFSLQAIKVMTMGDGGILVCRNKEDADRAKKLRWFSIDRSAKIAANWQPFIQRAMTFDVDEMGYKYQITNVDAAIGLSQLKYLQYNLEIRKKYSNIYRKELKNLEELTLLDNDEGHANWLFQVLVEDREDFQRYLGKNGVETNIVQVRNDIYKVFKKYANACPNMDALQDKYVSLPLNLKLKEEDIYEICNIIKQYYAL